MPIVSAKCTNCGANLNVDNTKDAAICEHCGAAFIVEKAINNYNITNNVNNNISDSVVNIYGGNSADFVIRAGTLEKYTGAATEVVIPNSVTAIGYQAFWRCTGLTSITIPNSVTSIGSDAFSCCSGLTSITIPNSVTSIGSDAFFDCSRLASITIPNSVTSIDHHAFSNCTGLTSVTIPNSVTSIGVGAFSYCSGLTSIHASNMFIDTHWRLFPNAPFYKAYQRQEEEKELQEAIKKRQEEARRRAEEERNKSSCYLTTACMEHQTKKFDDNCHELTVLRAFRDTYLKNNYPEDVETYYNTAPTIVETINATETASEIWAEVYQELVVPSVTYIENQKLEQAYTHYKNYSLNLAKNYLS